MSVEKNKISGIVDSATNISGDSGALRTSPLAMLNGRPLLSNRGVPLNLDWVKQVRVNTSSVERRAQTHVARRTVKKDWQAAWLLRAITCMDLTTLSGDDTDERVRRLCAKGRQPIQQDLVKQLGNRGPQHSGCGDLRVPPVRRNRTKGTRRQRRASRCRGHWISRRTVAIVRAHRRNPSLRRGWSSRD